MRRGLESGSWMLIGTLAEPGISFAYLAHERLGIGLVVEVGGMASGGCVLADTLAYLSHERRGLVVDAGGMVTSESGG